jgi:hypothetical protein
MMTPQEAKKFLEEHPNLDPFIISVEDEKYKGWAARHGEDIWLRLFTKPHTQQKEK